MSWFFFGTLCMLNAPTDCHRVVFDIPRAVTDLNRCCGKIDPPVFTDALSCLRALPSRWDNDKPFAVMGSIWTDMGCTSKTPQPR